MTPLRSQNPYTKGDSDHKYTPRRWHLFSLLHLIICLLDSPHVSPT